MHVVSVGCTSIFFSVESRQARITGLVNALSDHFTSFFFFFLVIWEQSLLCTEKEVQSQPSFSITFPSSLAPPSAATHWTHARCLPINETSKWMFNEHFRSHNGMSLMSCNDLPVDGHASTLSLSLRLWQLTMVWTLLVVDSASLHHSTTASIQVAALASL